MIQLFRRNKWHKVIRKSELFDKKYYLFTYPDVRNKNVEPIMHYIKYGAKEGRNPHADFITEFYLNKYKDISVDRINPFAHYILYGKNEGRVCNPDLKDLGVNQGYKIKSNGFLIVLTMKQVINQPILLKRFLMSIVNNGLAGTIIKIKRSLNIRKINSSNNRVTDGCTDNEVFIKYKEYKKLNNNLKALAFYLPQFHPFPENDEWWGKGFTEWTNVTKAHPNFVEHYQPHLPIHHGFYDLRVPEVMIEQARLARNYGIYGFNFYYYWFDGKVLMHKPYEILLKHKEIDINFCITWANENWTRTWDGMENDVLIAQNHCDEDSISFLESLYKYFEDERYIRIDNKPVLIVYRADIIPNMKETVSLWRRKAKEDGFDGLYLICSQTFGIKSPEPYGFDAAMEFPPHTAQSPEINHEIELTNNEFDGIIYDYSQVVENACKLEEPKYKLFRTAMLSWDNTARKQNHSHMFYNFSLSKYKEWLSHIALNVFENDKYSSDEKLVFINAWNEWAEGTHLEPDRKFGYGYLESTYDVIKDYSEPQDKEDCRDIKKNVDIIIVLDKNTNNSFLDTLKWFRTKTLLNILTINLGADFNCGGVLLSDCSKLSSYIGDLFIKIRGVYLNNIEITDESLSSLFKTTIPIVLNSNNKKRQEIIGIEYVNINESEINFELKILEALYNKTDLKPYVSIIVPAYNHDEFLTKRLDSIINQTFQDFELIMLDDCSKDESLRVIEKYSIKRPSSFYFANNANSGTPFKQWAKGINKSRGEIIWIAEDDDYCEEFFLEKLLPAFRDQRVKMVFSQSYMIDENENITDNYRDIFSTISPVKWNDDYNIPGYKEVMTALAIRNTIPNVSAVIFKKINIDYIVDDLVKYKFAGDWFFYLNLLSEGNIAFVKEPLNYHRRHAQSTMSILSDDAELYFNELRNIHDYVLANFVLDESSIAQMREYIESEYKSRKIEITNTNLYPLERLSIKSNYKKQKNIAVFFSGYYFGGAEIFPINLANAFAELGHNVFLFDVGSLESDERVKATVSSLVQEYDIKGTENAQQDLKDFLEKNKIDFINTQGWFATDFIQRNLTYNISYIPWFASMHGHEEAIINGEWGEQYFKYFDGAMRNTINKSPYFIYTHSKNLEVFDKYSLKDDDRLIELELLGMPSFLEDKKLKSQLKISRESFVVGFVARGIPEKGWEESIEAVQILNKEHSLNVHLVCIGDSEYVQKLKQGVDDDYIHFLGMSDEVMEWTQMFDVAMLPSFYKSESHPLVIMGYLQAGKPVITTPLGNIPDMLDYNGEKAGYLLDLKPNGRPSPQEISKYIKRYIENKELYTAHSQLAKKAFEKFNMKSIASRYVDIFTYCTAPTK